MNFSWNCVLKNKINIHHNTTCTYIPPSLSEDDIPETSNVKCTGRFEGTGVDVVDVVETVSFWDSSFFVVAGSLFFSFFLMPMDSKQIHTCLKQSKLNLFLR
jgi:hypothetical protein